MKTDLRTAEVDPRLKLNIDDNEFFQQRILSRPEDIARSVTPSKNSHKLLNAAATIAEEHVHSIVKALHGNDQVNRLIDWVEFVANEATVIMVKVPDYINAFTMFETLNDRGLRIAQSDLLKNYLFDKAGADVSAVHPKWAMMTGALESVGDHDITVDFIRHYWITRHGPTRERELSDKIKHAVNTRQKAVDFATALSRSANDYVALLNPHHEKWNDYGNSTRKHITTINHHLRVWQIRPLMLAVALHFPVEEGKKAFKMLVCWSVRFLVSGGRGGLLDRNYAVAAQEAGSGKIKTAQELYDKMVGILPNDAAFAAAFANAKVSKNYLARYYLRALEMKVKDDSSPELIPNDDEEVVNLEHVLPENPSADWNVNQQTASALFRAIGNMVLLKADINAKIGNAPFDQKKQHYAKSGFALTAEVAKSQKWGMEQIIQRQKRLSMVAVETWPLAG